MEARKFKLVTTQKYEEHDHIEEMMIEGVVAERNGSQYIKFEQVDTTYNVTINNLIKVKEGVVTIKRSGALNATMIFDLAKPYTTDYETPYGTLDVAVTTHEIKSHFADGVSLMISYEIMMQGKKISDNIYFIESL
ncbi:MAG: DUF1934 domain-containing protein [Niameybacter sp.]|uniref:DUF1934 domain-containing protein n=1 Tax=Niameybacter sp. TaxID=2033640 RepID=UPI002FCBD74C